MRYQVGQKYVFIHQQIESDVPRGFNMPRTFYPWRDVLHKLRIIVLTCTEHHKVPNHWDTENKLDCDGFIFVDDKGGRWLNQYPRASYGQLSDNADGYVEFDWPTGTDFNAIDADDDRDFTFEVIHRSLDTLLRGIKMFKRELNNCENPPEADKGKYSAEELAKMKSEYTSMVTALNLHLQFVITEVGKATSAVIEIRPMEFEKKDGTRESYPDILHAYVTLPGQVED